MLHFMEAYANALTVAQSSISHQTQLYYFLTGQRFGACPTLLERAEKQQLPPYLPIVAATWVLKNLPSNRMPDARAGGGSHEAG